MEPRTELGLVHHRSPFEALGDACTALLVHGVVGRSVREVAHCIRELHERHSALHIAQQVVQH